MLFTCITAKSTEFRGVSDAFDNQLALWVDLFSDVGLLRKRNLAAPPNAGHSWATINQLRRQSAGLSAADGHTSDTMGACPF